MTGAPVIPSPGTYEAAGDGLAAAIETLENIAIALRRVVDEDGDLRDGAPQPTLADVGALFSLTDDVTDQVDHLGRVAESLGELLVRLNTATRSGGAS